MIWVTLLVTEVYANALISSYQGFVICAVLSCLISSPVTFVLTGVFGIVRYN